MKGTVKSDGAMIGGFHEAVVYFRAEVRILVTHLVTLFKARSWDTKKMKLKSGAYL